MTFGVNSAYILDAANAATTVNGGLRLGIKGLVQPAIFGHVGVGMLETATSPNTTALNAGPEFDIGLGLDFKVAPGFTLGIQGAYNVVSLLSQANNGTVNAQSAKWFNFGLTAGFEFWEAPVRRVIYYR